MPAPSLDLHLHPRTLSEGTTQSELSMLDECPKKWNFLSLGNSNQKAIVDLEDYKRCAIYSWCLNKSGYVVARIKGKVEYLHKFIWNKEVPKGFVLDHEKGNKLDNRKSKLRIATYSQNISNSNPRKGRKYKGVFFHHGGKFSWKAQISLGSKSKHLGYFETEILAAKQYDKYAKYHYGEFAKTNF